VIVTALIECCAGADGGGAVETERLWHMPVGRRVECLFKLLRPGDDDTLHVAFGCGRGCGEESEITIGLDELLELQERAYASDHVTVTLDGQQTITLRRPTGQDQLDWLSGGHPDEAAATKAMLAALVVSDHEGRAAGDGVTPDDIRRIGETMDEQDPLIALTITADCAGCGATNEIAVDVEELVLQRLRRAQLDLLTSVHRLAAHYHWTEPDIFATPDWRRRQYLALIEAERP
jgi:hypothetical protein